MINKKHIVIAAVLALLSTGFNPALADVSNSLLQMDVKRSSVANTVDVTFYTTEGSANSVVTRKSNNRYVVLLPHTSSSASVTPGFGAVKDMITDIEVKHVNDGMGGYTKVTFATTKPINIKTAIKKTSPLTQAQKDYKAIIAQNNIKPAVQQTTQPKPQTQANASKPVSNVTAASAKPVEKVQKPAEKAQNQAPVQTKSEKSQAQTPKTTQQKLTPVKVAADVKKVSVDNQKAKTVQPVQKQKNIEPQQPQAKSTPVQQPKQQVTHSEGNYVPKMKFDEKGKRILDLEPRVSHKIVAEKPAKTPALDPIFKVDDNNQIQPLVSDLSTSVNADVSTAESVNLPDENNSSTNRFHFPMWILIAGGSVLALGVMYLVMDAMAHANEKDKARLESFFNMSSKNQAKRRRREYYDIVNDNELSWQEKYKLYTEKEEKRKPKKNPSEMSYVTDMSGLKKSITMPAEEIKDKHQAESGKPSEMNLGTMLDGIQNKEKTHEQIVSEKLQAKISQMEHALAQTPDIQEPEEISNEVKSEDDAIMNKLSDIKLKAFSKPLTLKETNRTLAQDEKKSSRNKSYKEGRFVKLKNSPLSVNKRKSAASNLEVSDLIDTGNKYLTNNGEMKMNKENENYLLSSLDEYLSILDTEEKSGTATIAKSSVADSLSQMKSSNIAMSCSGVTNPIARGSNPMTRAEKPMHYMNGLIVKSGYNIDSEKGFYVVNIDGVSALVGRIKDSIFILKKFDHVVDKPIQVRPDDANVYIVRVGKFKCLVDVSKDKMGTLIEI